jgi:cell division protease FtsH
MALPLHQVTSDHRELVRTCAEAAGIADPVGVQLDEFAWPILRNARRGPLIPLQGVVVRDWSRAYPRFYPGVKFGLRLYTLGAIRFARCVAHNYSDTFGSLDDFFIVARADYLPLFRQAVRFKRESAPPGSPPILAPGLLDTLRQNTIGYLRRDNLARIKELGGRARRGVLLAGPPGNGKTSACRWLWELCHELRYEFRLVSPDTYRAARASCNPAEAVKALFAVSRRGIVFFDDMDIALRDRALSPESDDQAVFLGAMDGIEVREGVVYVFTTNCPLDLIDPAFKRPGRIDLVLQFDPPTDDLRRQLFDRWHADVRTGIPIDRAVADTAAMSFAEIEELKNLLILDYLEHGAWDWDRAMAQWQANRHDLAVERGRALGFQRNGQPAAH